MSGSADAPKAQYMRSPARKGWGAEEITIKR